MRGDTGMARSSNGVTIKQIAAAAGVSVQVVSRALNGQTLGRRRDARERVERILELAGQLNYRRDLAATATRSGKFGTIAMVVSSGDTRRSNLPSALLAAITESLDQRNMHLSIARMSDQSLTDEERVPRLLRDLGADGLLINYNQWVPPAMNRLIEHHVIPAVWLNDKRPAQAVYPDDFNGAHQATEYLLALGHRRIAYAGHCLAPNVHYSEIDRRTGFEAAMQAAGLVPLVIAEANAEAQMRAFDAMLSEAGRPTAVLAYSVNLATNLIVAAAEQGIKCPRDISVMTFSGGEARAGRCLTMMRIPDAEVGRIGVEVLLSHVDRRESRPAVAVPLTMSEAETCRPMKKTVKPNGGVL